MRPTRRMTSRFPRRPDRAFTLVEMVATITVLSVIGLAATGIIATATDSYVGMNTTARLHSEASVALDRIVRELRSVPLRTEGETSGPDLNAVRTDRVEWGDGESVFLNDQSQLMLAIAGGDADVLLEDVTGFEVQAFDDEGSALAASMSWPASADVQRISVAIETSRNGVQDRVRCLAFVRSAMGAVEEGGG